MIKVEIVNDAPKMYFTTFYPENKYIEKTIAFVCERDPESFNISKAGKIEVYMRNGKTYSFEAWVTVYCSQFGINVSHDGQFVYVISDVKGLWCYTYKGDVRWKTRYTAPRYVVTHDDHSITTELNKKIVNMDDNRNIVAEQKLWGYSITSWISDSLISAQISNDKIVLLDSKTLAIKKEISLKEIGLVRYNYSKLSNDILTITGESLTHIWPTKIDIRLS